jgi:outer membrane immunogenic protein
MKNRLLASFAGLLLSSGVAAAADMPLKAWSPPVQSSIWSGCYVDGGGGYGLSNDDTYSETTAGLTPTSVTTTLGGRGWYGQAGAGCDYQVMQHFLIGAFGDYNFMNLHGQFMDPLTGFVGEQKETDAWAAGGRLGYIVSPALLAYLNGGYTQARFDQINFGTLTGGAPLGVDIAATTYAGWFLGGGSETSLAGLLGLGLPSALFLRSEYRYASYSAKDDAIVATATGAPTGGSDHVSKYVQTIGAALVYKFGWAGL